MDIIKVLDQKYKIIKRTSIMLFPIIKEYKCVIHQDLKIALEAEYKLETFTRDMKQVWEMESEIQAVYPSFNSFMNDVYEMIECDFINKGLTSERIVKTWVESLGFQVIKPPKSKEIELEAQGIDMQVQKYSGKLSKIVYRNVSIKQPSFSRAEPDKVIAQLDKMIASNCWLILVKDRIRKVYKPEELHKIKKRVLKMGTK